MIKLFALIILLAGAFFCIRILIRCLPGFFGKENLDAFKKTATHLADEFPPYSREAAVGKILTHAGAVLAVEVVKREQASELKKQILPLSNFLAANQKITKYFLFPLADLEQKISSWKERLAGGNFDFMALKSEIGGLRLVVSQNRLLFGEIEKLFSRSYELLEAIKNAPANQELRDSISELEAVLINYAHAVIPFGDLHPFFELKENLEKIIVLLEQCLEAGGEAGLAEIPLVDYYKVLEISRQASEEEIKKAYRKLSLKYHADARRAKLEKMDDVEFQQEIEKFLNEKFRLIKDAYEVLSDADKKSAYDQTLS